MLDLIAVTIAALAFVSWTAAMVAVGWYGQYRRQQREQQQRLARLIAQHQANRTPAKAEPRYPAASADVRRRAQA